MNLRPTIITLHAAWIIFFFSRQIYSQTGFEPCQKKYLCYFTPDSLHIDGLLTENTWNEVPWSDYFINIEGENKPAPLYPTRFKMLWDNQYLYIAAEITESGIWANLTTRDSRVYTENCFEIFIDPDGDTYNYCEMQINALGTIWDLLLNKPYRDGGRGNSAWNVDNMKIAIHIDGTINQPGDTDKQWTVELAIPWKSLGAIEKVSRPPEAGEQWRMNFSRIEWKTRVEKDSYVKSTDPLSGKPLDPSYSVWSPQGVINLHMPEKWGYVQFSSHLAGTSPDTFICKPEEKVKLFLRELYYEEGRIKNETGAYQSELDQSLIHKLQKEYGRYRFKINLIDKGYHIEAIFNKKETFQIDEGGRVILTCRNQNH